MCWAFAKSYRCGSYLDNRLQLWLRLCSLRLSPALCPKHGSNISKHKLGNCYHQSCSPHLDIAFNHLALGQLRPPTPRPPPPPHATTIITCGSFHWHIAPTPALLAPYPAAPLTRSPPHTPHCHTLLRALPPYTISPSNTTRCLVLTTLHTQNSRTAARQPPHHTKPLQSDPHSHSSHQTQSGVLRHRSLPIQNFKST
jgi:hypothetical protein